MTIIKCSVVPCTVKDKPFIFISYAHGDALHVFPVLEGLASSGYNIWYDHGIEINTTWSDEIANAILASDVVVVFVTSDSMASGYVRSEVEFALGKNIKVVPVYLESIDVLPPGLALTFHSTQGVHSNDVDEIVFRLCKWLTQNIKKETESWQPVASSTNEVPLSVPAVKKQREIRDMYLNRDIYLNMEDMTDNGGDNSWRPVLLDNKEGHGKEEEIWQPVKSSMSSAPISSAPMSTAPQPPSSVKKQQDRTELFPKREEKTDSDDDNYWHSGVHGNKEDYEKYLLIKSRLEGRPIKNRSAGAHASSSRPFMAMLLGIVLFVNFTEILNACLNWGFDQRAFVMDLLNWGVPSLIFYWYFSSRSTLRASFFENLTPGAVTPVIHWAFLLGWLLSKLNPDEVLKVWLPYIDKIASSIRVDTNLTQYTYTNLPQIPSAIKSAASIILNISGAYLALDVVVTAVTSFFSDRA